MSDVGQNTVAVLAERHGEHVSQPTLEALTLADTLGTPVAVWLGGAPSKRRCSNWATTARCRCA
ncbi:MAG: hypothetical protein NVV57_09195 [Demequina sp.]|nr:hypothetical protein [Demequina sp.]